MFYMLGQHLVTIIVGGIDTKKKRYTLCRWKLVETSEFFRAAFLGCFNETQKQIVRLEDEDPVAFDLVLQWIYCGEIRPPPVREERKSTCSIKSLSKSEITKRISQYLEFLIMADWLLVSPSPEEAAMEKIISLVGENLNLITAEHYRNAGKLPDRHCVRQLLVAAEMSKKLARSPPAPTLTPAAPPSPARNTWPAPPSESAPGIDPSSRKRWSYRP
jgi:hypothetical protein